MGGILLLGGCSGRPPSDIGVMDGKLTPCPGRPNCVSSINTDAQHHIDPIIYSGDKLLALETVKNLIALQKHANIVKETDEYLYVEFRSKLMGFVDDVEFHFPANESHIHIRSASRLGYSDLGANRKRMERIRTSFTEKMNTQ